MTFWLRNINTHFQTFEPKFQIMLVLCGFSIILYFIFYFLYYFIFYIILYFILFYILYYFIFYIILYFILFILLFYSHLLVLTLCIGHMRTGWWMIMTYFFPETVGNGVAISCPGVQCTIKLGLPHNSIILAAISSLRHSLSCNLYSVEKVEKP